MDGKIYIMKCIDTIDLSVLVCVCLWILTGISTPAIISVLFFDTSNVTILPCDKTLKHEKFCSVTTCYCKDVKGHQMHTHVEISIQQFRIRNPRSVIAAGIKLIVQNISQLDWFAIQLLCDWGVSSNCQKINQQRSTYTDYPYHYKRYAQPSFQPAAVFRID